MKQQCQCRIFLLDILRFKLLGNTVNSAKLNHKSRLVYASMSKDPKL